MHILVLNAGSSNLKCSLYAMEEVASATIPSAPLWQTQLDRSAGDAALVQALRSLWTGPNPVVSGPQAVDVVGHRIVHGGPDYRATTRITDAVQAAIAQYGVLAPAHNPASLRDMGVIAEVLGAVPQVAVFDTAFHRTMPPAATVYPLPYALVNQGIQRYGFHGISHQYSAHRVAQLMGGDVAALDLITCHLGNGCSLAAIHHGQSVETTMGFTPLEGLMMGTRSGSVDPGLLLYLLDQGQTPAQLRQMLEAKSGLLGLSGISGDLRAVLDAMTTGNSQARLAFEVYVHRLQQGIGAMLAALGRLDALVFTGGVGEHAALVRQAASASFGFLNLHLDDSKNVANPVDVDIAAAGSAVRIFVIAAQENWAIAQECVRWASGERPST